MENLTDLICSKLENSGEEEINFRLDNKSILDFNLSKYETEYSLNTCMTGNKNISEIDAILYMANFFTGLEDIKFNGEMMFSLTANDGTFLSMNSNRINPLNMIFYDVQFDFLKCSEEPYKSLPMLTEIVKSVYNLQFTPKVDYSGEEIITPFTTNQDLNLGTMIFGSSFLKYGTVYERASFEVISRLQDEGRLTSEDIENLRQHDPALIEEFPEIETIKGYALQPYHDISCISFLDLLNNPPRELKNIGITLMDNDSIVSIGNSETRVNRTTSNFNHPLAGSKIPKMQFANKSHDFAIIEKYINHIWETYQLMNGSSIDEIKECFKK